MRTLFISIVLLSFMNMSVIAQEMKSSLFEYESELEFKELNKTETKSPYALFGDNTETITTKHQKNLDHTLKIPMIMEGNLQIGLFEVNMQTGLASIKNNEGDVLASTILSNDEKARFTSMDPLAELYYSISPYAYCANNPLRYKDPTGLDWVYRVVDGVHEVYYDRSVRSQADVNAKYGEDGGVTHLSDGATLTSYDKDGNVTVQYTFTNDAKENKYGSVTDMNGNTLKNNQIEYGSNYTIFGTSNKSVNAETLHKNLFGSSYIGKDNPKDYDGYESMQYIPKGATDKAAYQHDLDYNAIGAAGPTSAFTDFNAYPADRALVERCRSILRGPNSSSKEKSQAKKVMAFFWRHKWI